MLRECARHQGRKRMLVYPCLGTTGGIGPDIKIVLEATKCRVRADHFLLNFDGSKGNLVVVKEILV